MNVILLAKLACVDPEDLAESEFIADRLSAAGLLVPAGLTAEKLRDLAQLLEDLGGTLGLVPEKAQWLHAWADALGEG